MHFIQNLLPRSVRRVYSSRSQPAPNHSSTGCISTDDEQRNPLLRVTADILPDDRPMVLINAVTGHLNEVVLGHLSDNATYRVVTAEKKPLCTVALPGNGAERMRCSLTRARTPSIFESVQYSTVLVCVVDLVLATSRRQMVTTSERDLWGAGGGV
jgi:hypothetical protein